MQLPLKSSPLTKVHWHQNRFFVNQTNIIVGRPNAKLSEGKSGILLKSSLISKSQAGNISVYLDLHQFDHFMPEKKRTATVFLLCTQIQNVTGSYAQQSLKITEKGRENHEEIVLENSPSVFKYSARTIRPEKEKQLLNFQFVIVVKIRTQIRVNSACLSGNFQLFYFLF